MKHPAQHKNPDQSTRSRWPHRLAVTGSVAAVLVVAGAGPASAATLLAVGSNPFEGVVPDFTVFGVEFTAAWQKLLAGVWGLGFVVTGFSAVRAVVSVARTKRGGYGTQVAEQTEDAKFAVGAFVGLTMLGVIVGGVIALMQ